MEELDLSAVNVKYFDLQDDDLAVVSRLRGFFLEAKKNYLQDKQVLSADIYARLVDEVTSKIRAHSVISFGDYKTIAAEATQSIFQQQHDMELSGNVHMHKGSADCEVFKIFYENLLIGFSRCKIGKVPANVNEERSFDR